MSERIEPEPGAGIPGARFEGGARRIGLWLGPAVALAAGGLATSLTGEQRALSALMAFCAIYWITEPVPAPVTALLAMAGSVLLGIAEPGQAFGALGKPLLFLFIGSFFIAEAMKVHGLGARLARNLAGLARGRLSLLCALSGSAWLMSMWMSNTAATAICLPIAIAVADAAGDRRLGTALVLAVAYGASVGGIATPVGTPPNIIGLGAMREAGHHIDFLHWMGLGLPLATVMLLGLWLLLAALFRVRPGQPLGGIPLATGQRTPWSQGEIAVLIALSLAISAWLLPGVLELVAPGSPLGAWLDARLGEAMVAICAGCLLFVLPARDPSGAPRPALTWREAAGIDWGVILLFAGGILLGDLARATGLAEVWGTALVSATGAESTWALTALVTAIAILLSEAASNTATATLIAPLAISLAEAAGASPLPPVLGATLGASYGFMLPISTAPNAMAYSTGFVRVPTMMRTGIFFDIVGFAVIVGGLRLLAPLFGFD
jgi:sodium-dependent dicarboxylate transporter 2/3/5